MTNDKSPFANNQSFVFHVRLNRLQKPFVIGEWLLVICYLTPRYRPDLMTNDQ
jgi:hypothetical protein